MAALSVASLAASEPARAAGPILRRRFGHGSEYVSTLGLGGRRLGDAASADEASNIVHEAVEGGITFFDNAWEYNDHRSEEWMGAALRGGYRDRVFLMTQVCTHGRDGTLGLQMLEESLKRLGTDRLDLWQIHAVVYDNDPELAYRKGGIIDAMAKAKEQGKVRYVGFSGHKSPDIHLKMIEGGFPFDSVQFPINAFDAQFRSFQQTVLAEAHRRGMAVLGTKPLNGGAALHSGDVKVTPQEALRYAMSVPGVTTTITGMESLAVLRQNLAIVQNFKPMTKGELSDLETRVAPFAADGRFELYKTSLADDGLVTRVAHGMPLAGAQT